MIAPVAVCPGCAEENPDRFRMCGMCGAAPLSTAQAPERRERRVASVVFADLAGFTSRSERLDVEGVGAFLAPYRERLRQEVERNGGHLNLAATYAARVPPSGVMCSVATTRAGRLNASARAAEALALTTRTITLA